MARVHVPAGPLPAVRVLGIDPSLSCTGWAVVNDRADCLRSGVIRPHTKAASARVRGWEIAYQLAQLIPDLKPTHVFMEEPTLHGHASISIPLSRLNGALGMAIAVQTNQRLHVTDLNVKEWREAVGFVEPKREKKSKGSAKRNTDRLKAAVLAHASRRWPRVNFSTPDAAEAALIALRGLMHIEGAYPIVIKPRKKRKKKAK